MSDEWMLLIMAIAGVVITAIKIVLDTRMRRARVKVLEAELDAITRKYPVDFKGFPYIPGSPPLPQEINEPTHRGLLAIRRLTNEARQAGWRTWDIYVGSEIIEATKPKYGRNELSKPAITLYRGTKLTEDTTLAPWEVRIVYKDKIIWCVACRQEVTELDDWWQLDKLCNSCRWGREEALTGRG